MSRPQKNPDFDPDLILSALVAAVVDSYTTPSEDEAAPDTTHKQLRLVAEEFRMTPLKVRKLLITGNAYETPLSVQVHALYRSGKTIQQIQELTQLSRASVHGYLPYSKGVYKATELSTDAERIKLYRARKAAVKALKVCGIGGGGELPGHCGAGNDDERPECNDDGEDALWNTVELFAGYPFFTAKGLKYSYTVRGNELFVNRKEKSITRATVELAYQRARDEKVTGPKQIGTFGASYLYPMFVRFGIIEAALV